MSIIGAVIGCPDCGDTFVKDTPRRSFCKVCGPKRKKLKTDRAARAFQARSKEAGLCRCGGILLGNKKCCEYCLEYRKSYGKSDEGKAARKRVTKTLKLEAIEAYGGQVCRCCGETLVEFLTLDHVNGDGAEHRKSNPNAATGRNFYLWLKRKGYPQELNLRILCMNCNFSRGTHGYCPHEKVGQ